MRLPLASVTCLERCVGFDVGLAADRHWIALCYPAWWIGRRALFIVAGTAAALSAFAALPYTPYLLVAAAVLLYLA